MIDELQQALVISLEIGDRARRDSRFHRRPGNGRRDVDDQSRIERFRNQVIRTELHVVDAVGGGDDIRLLGHRQIGDRMHGRELHRFIDGRRADVECTAKNEREAEDVVDLIRKVGTAGGDDRVGARLLGEIRA